jgi:hypothetical protein
MTRSEADLSSSVQDDIRAGSALVPLVATRGDADCVSIRTTPLVLRNLPRPQATHTMLTNYSGREGPAGPRVACEMSDNSHVIGFGFEAKA